jgi:hypothetical protein
MVPLWRSFVKFLAAAAAESNAARDLCQYGDRIAAKQNICYTWCEDSHQLPRHGLSQRLLEFPEVRQAQLEASQYFVNMLELQRAVGHRVGTDWRGQAL